MTINGTVPTPHSYGWRKDPYNPQAVYHCPKAVAVPPTINLLNFCPPVRDQDGVGACTGFGIGGMAYTVALAYALVHNLPIPEIFSPNWLYNGARFIEGTLSQDAGANPQDVFNWALQNGLLVEHLWPFQDKLDKTAPGTTRMAEATKYANFTVFRVADGVSGITSAMADGHCVAIGCPWPGSWVSGSKNILPAPDYVDGGHETFLYGYDYNEQSLFLQNSWGTGWSSGGRCKIPFSALDWFKTNGGYDAHYITMDGPIVPPPPKPPKKCWFGIKQKPAQAAVGACG